VRSPQSRRRLFQIALLSKMIGQAQLHKQKLSRLLGLTLFGAAVTRMADDGVKPETLRMAVELTIGKLIPLRLLSVGPAYRPRPMPWKGSDGHCATALAILSRSKRRPSRRTYVHVGMIRGRQGPSYR
jgi:hypothetical protein